MKLILTSAAPYHHHALELIGKRYSVKKGELKEPVIPSDKPHRFAIRSAVAKAKVVAPDAKNSLVLGLHTLAVYRNHPVEHPKFKMDALDILNSFSGTSHLVISAWALIDTKDNVERSGYAKTRVFFHDVPTEDLTHYVNDHDVVTYPTGYHPYATPALKFIDKIEGSVSGFMYHLPLEQVAPLLS